MEARYSINSWRFGCADNKNAADRGAVREVEFLQHLFQSSRSVVHLPHSALRLIEEIDHEVATTFRLEEIIASDPALAAQVLRVANSGPQGLPSRVGSIRGAILRLGLESVRAIALSLCICHGVRSKAASLLDPARFARHSLFVGLMCRWLFERLQKASALKSKWSSEEILAAGVIHELALAILASSAPEVFQRSQRLAEKRQISLPVAFEALYGISVAELAGDACDAWRLPPLFGTTVRHMNAPQCAGLDEFDAAAALHYADFLAESHGYGLEARPARVRVDEQVATLLQLDEEAKAFAFEAVENKLVGLLELVDSRESWPAA